MQGLEGLRCPRSGAMLHLKRREYDWEELERYRKEERIDYNPTQRENPGVPIERST